MLSQCEILCKVYAEKHRDFDCNTGLMCFCRGALKKVPTQILTFLIIFFLKRPLHTGQRKIVCPFKIEIQGMVTSSRYNLQFDSDKQDTDFKSMQCPCQC